MSKELDQFCENYEVRVLNDSKRRARYHPPRFFTDPSRADLIRNDIVEYETEQVYTVEIPEGRLRALVEMEQRFFKWHGFIWKPTLKAVTHFFVQNESTFQLMKKIKFDNVTLSGDTRFDRVIEIAKSPADLPWISSFKKNDFLVVIGSSYSEEESLMAMFLQRVNHIKVCVVPHEIHSSRIQESLLRFEKYGAVLCSSFQPEKNSETRVLIVDSIGMLSSIYSQANGVVLGGGFGKGLHNSLEIAVYGVPMAFGPNYKKFQEAIDLVRIGAAFPIESLEEFSSFIENAHYENSIPNAGKKYVEEHAGATSAILKGIEKYSA